MDYTTTRKTPRDPFTNAFEQLTARTLETLP